MYKLPVRYRVLSCKVSMMQSFQIVTSCRDQFLESFYVGISSAFLTDTPHLPLGARL